MVTVEIQSGSSNDNNIMITHAGQFVWIQQPRNMTVTVGSDVFIPCEYSGVGSMWIPPDWMHNEEMFHTLMLPLQYSYNQSGLIIHNITLAMNMDRYSCRVELFSGYHESTVGIITVTRIKVLSSVNGKLMKLMTL